MDDMLLADLNSTYLRDTYLRGIDLGAAWMSTAGSAAMDELIEVYLVRMEQLLGVRFCLARVHTLPPSTQVAGRDYDITGAILPYQLFPGGVLTQTLYLPLPDVWSLEQVRLWEGDDGGNPPALVFETIPPSACVVSRISGILTVPLTTLASPQLGRGWAIDYTIGLGQIPVEVAQWVALQVAMHVLAVAGSGQDLAHGLSAWTLTQDGVSESTSFGGQGKLGIYGSTITALQTMAEGFDLATMRRRYQRRTFPAA
jgi:hypothetical protein